jgi:hypothetical protein
MIHTTTIELTAEQAEHINASVATSCAEGDEVQVEAEWFAEDCSFDHEFGTEKCGPFVAIEGLTFRLSPKIVDLYFLATDEQLKHIETEIQENASSY